MSNTAVEARSIRYLFLDVVEYTQQRSVEAQVDIVGILNKIVLESVAEYRTAEGEIILLPTGDGMGVALIDDTLEYDVHVLLALSILKSVEAHNLSIDDKMRQFGIRVGVNQNVDNIVIDINGARNVAGAGINMAQRVMSVADSSQLMVGQL